MVSGLGAVPALGGSGLCLGEADFQIHWGWDSWCPKFTTLFSAAGPVSTFSISQVEVRPATWSQGTGTARWTELQGLVQPVPLPYPLSTV